MGQKKCSCFGSGGHGKIRMYGHVEFEEPLRLLERHPLVDAIKS